MALPTIAVVGGDLFRYQLYQWLEETCGVTSYSNGRSKDVVNQCLELRVCCAAKNAEGMQ